MGSLSEFEVLRLNWAFWTVGFQDLFGSASIEATGMFQHTPNFMWVLGT